MLASKFECPREVTPAPADPLPRHCAEAIRYGGRTFQRTLTQKGQLSLPLVGGYLRHLCFQSCYSLLRHLRRMNAAKALGRVVQLSSGAKSEYVQLEASKDLLDRAGFKPIDRSQVQVAGDIKVSIDLT